MQILSPIEFVVLDLWLIKDGICRPLPDGQKLYFWLALFHQNCDVLRTLLLEIYTLLTSFWGAESESDSFKK